VECYLFFECALVCGGPSSILTSQFVVVLAKVEPSLLYSALRLVVGLKHAVVVLHTVSGSLIIKLIFTQLIIMAAHHSDVAKALSLVHALPWVLTIMIRKFRDCVQNWAG